MSLAPFRMTPAYRHGEMTPWGGNDLRRIYHKEIPDDKTGESLEVSAIPGLESRNETGETLTQLIDRYKERLVGTCAAGPFPLLLKLLDARDQLSVQVHPDDAYAARVENKLGKTEAWHILYAEEGAQIVYGVVPGTTKEELKAASLSGRAVEEKLRRVSVRAGETYYIPAGTVHALGKGIVLYEIQQSSDVTYRFYDWDRKDASGHGRQLHIDKAVDVADVRSRLEKASEIPLEAGHGKLLEEKYFSLEIFRNYRGMLLRDPRRFSILTALKSTRLSWEGGEIEMAPGQTVLLPADGYDLSLNTEEALLAYPTIGS